MKDYRLLKRIGEVQIFGKQNKDGWRLLLQNHGRTEYELASSNMRVGVERMCKGVKKWGC